MRASNDDYHFAPHLTLLYFRGSMMIAQLFYSKSYVSLIILFSFITGQRKYQSLTNEVLLFPEDDEENFKLNRRNILESIKLRKQKFSKLFLFYVLRSFKGKKRKRGPNFVKNFLVGLL